MPRAVRRGKVPAGKGTAACYTVVVDGQENSDAAWYYDAPKPAAVQIKDHIAFWRGVAVER
jgi:uncharacterized protein (DUF427 family)